MAGIFAVRMKAAQFGHALGSANGMRGFRVGPFVPTTLVALVMGIWMAAVSPV